jgi:hypothetical protein
VIREAREKARKCYKCGEVGIGVRHFPYQSLAAIETETIKRDETNDAATKIAIYAARYALMAS